MNKKTSTSIEPALSRESSRRRGRWCAFVSAVGLCSLAPVISAGELYQFQEYGASISSAQKISALADDAYGDRIALFTGSMEFSATDISIPGNNALPVALSRRFVVEVKDQGRDTEVQNLGGFYDWDVEVPYLEGTFAQSTGWQTAAGGSPTNRCSVPGPPASPTITVDLVWHGYNLHMPGAGDQKLLGAIANTYSSPTDGATYPWVTRTNMRFSCLSTTANSYPGQGFLGVTTDGKRYFFNWGIERTTPSVKQKNGAQTVVVTRKRVLLLATRIEDRFGNWVNYNYTGDQLTSITSNDGRTITLTYTGGRVTSATANSKTWTYQYTENVTGTDGGLSAVNLPDGSKWSYAKTGRLWSRQPIVPDEFSGACDIFLGASLGPFSYSVTHPSGATAQFNLSQKTISRVFDPTECGGPQPGYYDVWSIDSKVITGPGISSLTTSYSIDLRPASASATDKWSTVTHPDGTKSRYRYGTWTQTNDFEAKLLEEQALDAANTVIKDRTITYVTDSQVGPYPGSIGTSFHNFQFDEPLIRPTKIVSTTLDGATFSNTVNTFDTLARPLSVTRSSTLGSPAYTRTDITAYADNPAKWVMGLVSSTTNSDTGLVASQTTYDPTTAVPTDFYIFGLKKQSLTYNTDGTVATVKDGANHTTTLSSWKRGIPQSISYADSTSQSAVVNDDGWITSVTDQNTYVTTYGYDTMGRLTSITYPTADDVAWNTNSQIFEQVLSTEYGIPAGHWRRTESTGNARKITYFDALWRPMLTSEYDTANPGGTQRYQRFGYDYANRPTFTSYPGTTDALTTGTTTQYDAIGRPTTLTQDSELGSLVTHTDYLSGYQVRVTNPRTYVTTTSYQAFDQPTYDFPSAIQLPEGAYTDISRDVFGKPISITRRDATSTKSVTRSYVYDANQQLCKTVEPETGATVMDYDAAGNLAWSAAGLNLTSTTSCDRSTAQTSGRAVTRAYDTRNRIQTLTFPDSNGNQTWTYTLDGLVDTVTTTNSGSTVTNHYDYNKRRLLKDETMTQPGSSTWTVLYGFNTNGSQATVTYPVSGTVINYAPNALGQATQAGSYASGVTYYPNGAIHQFTYGNGLVHTMTQNARQLPEHLTDNGASNAVDNTYSYDANGNVQQIGDAVPGNSARVMTYDGLDRLLETDSAAFGGTDGKMTYTYDVLDNLKSAKLTGVKQYNYGYDPTTNRLTSVTDNGGNSIFGLSYDLQGNLSSKNAQGFTFDYGNRLRTAELSGSDVEAYRYDAYGRRVNAWSAANGNILSMYSADGVLRHQLDERTAKSIDYIYLGGSLLARVSNAAIPGVPVVSTTPSGSVSGGTFSVQWTARAGSTSYELQESFNGGAWQANYSGTAVSQAMSSKPSGNYSYRVRACGTPGCSNWTAGVAIAVASPPFGAPTITVPATGLNGNYTISWTAANDASSYVLEESANGGAFASAYSGTNLSQAFTSKPAGTYGYRAKACNANGCGPYSSTGSVQTLYPPASAPSVSAPSQSTTGSYTVSWTSVSGATSYRLEEQTNGGAWTQIQDAASTSMAISGKSAATYGYRARACNASGCGSYSTTATTQVVLPPTGAPTVSVPSSNNTGSYTVSWTSVTDATSYRLEESANGGAWTEIQNAASTSASVSSRGSGSYSYRARGCNAGGCGPYSTAQTVTVTLPPPVPANFQVIMTLANATQYKFTASWSASPGATCYEMSGHAISCTATSAVWFVATEDYDGMQYAVRACNAAGCSAWSPLSP